MPNADGDPTPTALDAHLNRCLQDPGWAVTGVHAAGMTDDPPFAYTTGLWHSVRHAELLLIGLPYPMSGHVLNGIGRHLAAGGAPLVHGDVIEDPLISQVPLQVRAVAPPPLSHFAAPRRSYAYYHDEDVPLFQIVWPDKHGTFPPSRAFWPFSDPRQTDGTGLWVQPLLPLLLMH